MKISNLQILLAISRLEAMNKKPGSGIEENYLLEQINNNPDLLVTNRAIRRGMKKLEGKL